MICLCRVWYIRRTASLTDARRQATQTCAWRYWTTVLLICVTKALWCCRPCNLCVLIALL